MLNVWKCATFIIMFPSPPLPSLLQWSMQNTKSLWIFRNMYTFTFKLTNLFFPILTKDKNLLTSICIFSNCTTTIYSRLWSIKAIVYFLYHKQFQLATQKDKNWSLKKNSSGIRLHSWIQPLYTLKHQFIC